MDVAQLSQILKQATGVVASRGEGVLLYDEDDRRYLDFTAGMGVTSTGHCHPRVVEAAQRQVGTLIHGQYTTVLHRPLLTLVERLGDVLPPGLDRMFFANSGSVRSRRRCGSAVRPPGARTSSCSTVASTAGPWPRARWPPPARNSAQASAR